MKILTTCLPNRQANQTNHTNNYTLGIGNRLSSWGDNGEAHYNIAGCLTNMVSDIDGRELNLSWNERYQLSTVNVGSGTNVNYGYNVLGQRISRIELIDGVTNTEYYVHDGVNIVADLDEDKELLRSYSYAPGYDNIISMTSYGDSETNTYFYIRNHNNSVVALVDEDGDIAESYEYSVYGEVTVFDANGNELDESALGNRYTFQGREIDWTTGLYNFRARYYDPETGRWLSKDPIGINGGLNQYVFCGDNPVMFGDPEGLKERNKVLVWIDDLADWGKVGKGAGLMFLGGVEIAVASSGGVATAPAGFTTVVAVIVIADGSWKMSMGFAKVLEGFTTKECEEENELFDPCLARLLARNWTEEDDVLETVFFVQESTLLLVSQPDFDSLSTLLSLLSYYSSFDQTITELEED